MIEEDIKTLARISKALWVDNQYSKTSVLETISAVSLMDLTPERALEKASVAILQKAQNKGLLTNAQSQWDFILTNPFYRLLPEERFLLVALHLGHWSYLRLSRIMRLSEDKIQEIAWRARINLCGPKEYPSGPSQMSSQCPEYDFLKPWTQKFLDDEMGTGSDRVFLQNHLMVCSSCSRALARCRDLYFKVDREISGSVQDSDFEAALEKIFISRPFSSDLSFFSFIDSLRIFIKRRDVQIAVILLAILVISKLKFVLK